METERTQLDFDLEQTQRATSLTLAHCSIMQHSSGNVFLDDGILEIVFNSLLDADQSQGSGPLAPPQLGVWMIHCLHMFYF